MRIVVDVNILARVHPNATGPARRLLMSIWLGPHAFILSREMFEELERVLFYPRLLRRSLLTPDQVLAFLRELVEPAELVTPAIVPAGLLRDPNDDPVLGTALAGNAEILCTNDLDLLDEVVRGFARTHGIRVMTDLELLALLDAG